MIPHHDDLCALEIDPWCAHSLHAIWSTCPVYLHMEARDGYLFYVCFVHLSGGSLINPATVGQADENCGLLKNDLLAQTTFKPGSCYGTCADCTMLATVADVGIQARHFVPPRSRRRRIHLAVQTRSGELISWVVISKIQDMNFKRCSKFLHSRLGDSSAARMPVVRDYLCAVI